MHLGIVGVGRIGRMHARHAMECGRFDAVTLYDTDELLAKEHAERLGVAGTSELDVVLSRADAVLVANPTPYHGETVRAALAAGVHVLCEKPLAMDATTITELAALVPAGVHLVVGFQRRFDPAYTRIRRAVAAGEYGTVYLARATAFDHEPPDLGYIATSGGIFRDQFVHDLDSLPWLLGERVESVRATGSVLVDPAFAEAGDVDVAAVVLGFAGGAIGLVAGGRRNGGGYDNRLELFAERASVATGLDDRTPLHSLEPGAAPPPDPHRQFTTRWAGAYRRELEVFADIVAGRAENPSPPLDSLHSLEIALACGLALRTGRTVTIAPDGTIAADGTSTADGVAESVAPHQVGDTA